MKEVLRIELNSNDLYDLYLDNSPFPVKCNITMDEALAEIAKVETEDNDD